MDKKRHKYLKGGQVKLDKNKVPKGYHKMPDGSCMPGNTHPTSGGRSSRGGYKRGGRTKRRR